MTVISRRAFVCLAALVLITTAGCGGGGGGGSTTPIINGELFTPNYISALDGLYHWNHLPVRVRFNLPANWSQLYPGNTDLYIVAANEWNQTGKQALLTVVPFGSAADATVEFVSYTQLSIPGAQGVTESTHSSSGVMLSATVKIALDNPRFAQISATEARSTIAHELGHAIGIIGHSPNTADLMYPTHYYNSDLRPTFTDLNTAMSAYPTYFSNATAGTTLYRASDPFADQVITETIE